MLGAALPSAVSCIGAGYGQWGRESPIGVGKLPAPMACCLLQRAVSIALLPAPVACCLLRWPVACSNAAVSIALLPAPVACCLPRWPVACPGGLLPAPVACCLPRCWPAFARDRAGLVGAPGRSSVMRSAVVRAGARAVLQAKSRSRRGAPACRVDVRAVLHADQRELPVGHPPVGLVYGQFCMLFVTTVRPSTRPSGWCSGCFACGVGLSKAYRHFASVIALTKCGGAGKAEPLCRAAPQPPTRILVSL